MKVTTLLPSEYSNEELTRDFKTATDCGKVRIGTHGLYFTKLFGADCLPYSAIVRAELTRGTLLPDCCKDSVCIMRYLLETTAVDGSQRKTEFKLRDEGKEAVEKLSAANPSAEIVNEIV